MRKLYSMRAYLTLCILAISTLIGGVSAQAQDAYKTLLFGSSYNSGKISGYTNSWTSTVNNFTWNIANFNNNSNNWNYVKCGSDKKASVATITTATPIDKAIKEVKITVDAVTTTDISSAKLSVSTDANFPDGQTTDYSISLSKGAVTCPITTPQENSYYKLTFDCKKASSNGPLQISKVEYFASEGGTEPEPTTNALTFTPASGTLAAATNVEISATADGSTIYYTTDGTEPSTTSAVYTAAIPVTKSGTTLKALAVAEGFKDATAEATYTIKPEQPVFSQGSTTFNNPLSITLSLPASAENDAEIHYAIGATATAESALYEGPIAITGKNDGDKVILHAIVVDKYGNVGTEKYCTYTYSNSNIFDFTPTSGAFGITPTNNSNATSSNVDGVEMEVNGITMVTSTATGKTYNKLWSASSACELRIYSGNSFTISAPDGYVLSGIKFTFNGSNKGEFNDSYSAEELGEESKTFTAGSQARIKTIEVSITPKATEPEAYTLKVGATGYATLCIDKAYVMPEGLQGAVVSVSGNILSVDYMYTKDDIVAAGMPLLIKADKAGDYTLTYTTAEGTTLETMMSGETDSEGMTVGAAGSKFYKLAAPAEGIGFYWGAADGAAFKNGTDKAYLVVTGTVPVQGFRFDGTTTGISGIDAEGNTPAVIYGIDGRRINGKADQLPRGIYIIGGKKIIK